MCFPAKCLGGVWPRYWCRKVRSRGWEAREADACRDASYTNSKGRAEVRSFCMIVVDLLLPWHLLRLHIWYWRTRSFARCWSQSGERLSEPCRRNPRPFGPTPLRSAATWRHPGKHGSGWGPGRPSPWFSLLWLPLLGVCHILECRERKQCERSVGKRSTGRFTCGERFITENSYSGHFAQ